MAMAVAMAAVMMEGSWEYDVKANLGDRKVC